MQKQAKLRANTTSLPSQKQLLAATILLNPLNYYAIELQGYYAWKHHTSQSRDASTTKHYTSHDHVTPQRLSVRKRQHAHKTIRHT